MRVVVQTERFDPGAELNRFSEGLKASGATVSFTGITRDVIGELQAMEIECYPGMTEKALKQIATDAMTRWSLEDALIIHRHGRLKAQEEIMMVATAARHRVAAFDAAQFLMDYLKSRAPFWKKEVTREGASWVDAKDIDEDALTRWQD